MGYLRKVVNEWRALRRRATLLDRRALARAYLKVQAKYLLLVRLLRMRPRRERVLGIRLRFPDYAAFAMMFEEIFVREEYRFEPTDAPFVADCGANVGVALAWFKAVAPRARVVCFEPDPETCRLLEDNVLRNGWSGVEVVNAAVSDREGELDLSGEAGSPMMTTRAGVWGGGTRPVRAVRLSRWISGEADLVKLDVEGAERAVIEDLAATGALGRVRRLAIEYHHHMTAGDELSRVLRPLEEAGFTYALWAPSPLPLDPATRQNLLIVASRPQR